MSDASPFRFRDYRAFWAARLASTIGNTMLVVVIGIHVYDIARRSGMSIKEASFWLGMIGIAQFLPLFLLLTLLLRGVGLLEGAVVTCALLFLIFDTRLDFLRRRAIENLIHSLLDQGI